MLGSKGCMPLAAPVPETAQVGQRLAGPRAAEVLLGGGAGAPQRVDRAMGQDVPHPPCPERLPVMMVMV